MVELHMDYMPLPLDLQEADMLYMVLLQIQGEQTHMVFMVQPPEQPTIGQAISMQETFM
jgi:hypothetical protein